MEGLEKWASISLLKSFQQPPPPNLFPQFSFTPSTLVYFLSSVAQSCLILCNPMDCSTPGLPVHHQFLELTQTHVHWVVMPSNHLIPCCPLLFLPSIFSSNGVFFNESVLHLRWPKYWSFSFSISPSNEYSGLISFRIGKSKGLSKVFSIITFQKHQFFGAQLSLWSNSPIHTWLLEKP